MLAARIYYRMVTAGIELRADGDRLAVTSGQPLTDEQRQAVRDHKPDLLDLAGWFGDDAVIIRMIDETTFLWLADDLKRRREHYRRHYG